MCKPIINLLIKDRYTCLKSLDKFWSTQEILYDYEAPLTLTTETGNYELLILDSGEDLIIEEPSGSCNQNRPKV